MKYAILGLNTFNLLSSNSFSPVLINFMTYPILPLSATLTQFETSVGGRITDGKTYLSKDIVL